MSKSVEEMLKELVAFAEKASAAKAEALIKCAPTDVLQRAFRAACNVAVELAKGELKPENVPDNAPELALIIMVVEAAKRMGIDPEEMLKRDKESGEVGGEAGKPEQSEGIFKADVTVISGTHDEIMAKIGDLIIKGGK